MPFNSETSKTAGRKGGLNRWKTKDKTTNRTEQLKLMISKEELKMVNEQAKKFKISRVELAVRAINSYNDTEQIKKEKEKKT